MKTSSKMPAHHVRDTGFNYTYVITESKKVLDLFIEDKLGLDSDMSSFLGKNLNNKIDEDAIRSLKSGKWYVGATSDLRKRFSEHQANKSNYTKGKGPYEIIYYEASRNLLDCFAREKYLKTGMGRRYLKNRLKRFLSLT